MAKFDCEGYWGDYPGESSSFLCPLQLAFEPSAGAAIRTPVRSMRTSFVGAQNRSTSVPAQATDSLRRLPNGGQECAPHSLPVRKSHFVRNHVQRETPFFQHKPRGFHAQMFDGLSGRLTGLRAECPTELPRTSPGDVG